MVCPKCRAKTDVMRTVEGPELTVRLLACITPECPLRAGFYTIEAVTGEEIFRAVLTEAERKAREVLR